MSLELNQFFCHSLSIARKAVAVEDKTNHAIFPNICQVISEGVLGARSRLFQQALHNFLVTGY
jgi:hypothetical protein